MLFNPPCSQPRDVPARTRENKVSVLHIEVDKIKFYMGRVRQIKELYPYNCPYPDK